MRWLEKDEAEEASRSQGVPEVPFRQSITPASFSRWESCRAQVAMPGCLPKATFERQVSNSEVKTEKTSQQPKEQDPSGQPKNTSSSEETSTTRHIPTGNRFNQQFMDDILVGVYA